VFTLRTGAAPEPRFDFSDAGAAVTPRVPDTHGPLAESGGHDLESLAVLSDLRPLGQIHDSFIIAAGRDGLWIIDQHVAHERILFEKVLRQQAEGRVESQHLLMPILLELTAAQQIEYARVADELERSGFESEPFGTRTIAVKAAPAGVGPGDIEKLVFEILEIAESELRKVSVGDLRRSMAASIACRAAIKVNMRLDHTKMTWLLNELAATQCPMSCPHGRPIALRYSTRDILKSFHRI
jgi:DNA mismatch repair protein MutL